MEMNPEDNPADAEPIDRDAYERSREAGQPNSCPACQGIGYGPNHKECPYCSGTGEETESAREAREEMEKFQIEMDALARDPDVIRAENTYLTLRCHCGFTAVLNEPPQPARTNREWWDILKQMQADGLIVCLACGERDDTKMLIYFNITLMGANSQARGYSEPEATPHLLLGIILEDGTEPTAQEYCRVVMGDNDFALVGVSFQNVISVTFPEVKSNWGTIVGVAIFKDGELLQKLGMKNPPFDCRPPNQIIFPPGNIQLNIDPQHIEEMEE